MTTFHQIELQCPVCDSRFNSQAVVETNGRGVKRTDFQSWDGVDREERAVLTYLVGELWRRVGDLKLARTWFDKVSDEILDPATQQWVLDAARQQRDAPREWFG
jgi:hypothetical protein